MSIFKKGQRVSLKQTPSVRGYVDEVFPLQAGYQFYDIKLDDGSIQTLPEHELIPEVIIQSPWDLLENNSLGDYRNFSIASTLHKIRNTTANTISTLKASRTLFKPYQFKPLVKFLKSDKKRILIADEVGLGKTIEAGHIMLEMAARNDMRNVLVVCTKSLSEKWKTELQEKFNIILKIYNSVKDLIEDIRNDIAASRKSIFGIINYEKCRNKKIDNILEANSYNFDLLICDEAHKIRNSETQQHKGVAMLVEHSEAVVFMTATPIMTDISNLHNLIRVLDREVYDNYSIFTNAVNQNKPFIKALSQLNANYPLSKIAEELHSGKVLQQIIVDEKVVFSEETVIGELFKDDQLYQRANSEMMNNVDNLPTRVRIQQDLMELNSLNSIYSRTRKKDVLSDSDKTVRNPYTITVDLTDEESLIYEGVINEYDNPDSLGLMQRKRQMASCIAAFNETKEVLLAGRYDRELSDSKFDAFRTILNEVIIKNKKKLIVFAFFTKTLLYLRLKLQELNIQSEIIYGDIDDRAARIENFRTNSEISVLLSSEVGSEGLDMQFCDALVNYDLPWNPMVVEQRIGRIDRVGQLSPAINIYNLVITGTIEEKIYTRLYQRINLFRESIGDLEEILGEAEPLAEKIKKGIDRLYTSKLTDAQQNLVLDEISKAIENEKQNLEKIRVDLQDAFANDLHFQNEVENIEKNKRYITKEEVVNYLEAILRIELSVIRLENINDDVYSLEIPANSTGLLFDFIEKHKDTSSINPELENLYRKFKAKHFGARKILLTFSQLFAYQNKSTEYVSAFHPLVNAISNYFQAKNLDKNQAHKIGLKRERLTDTLLLPDGFYVLVMYKIILERNYGNGKVNQISELHSVLADLNGDEVEILEKKIGEQLNATAEIYGEQMVTSINLNKDVVKKIRAGVSMEIIRIQNEVKENETLRFVSSIRRRAEQEIAYLQTRINRMQKMIDEKRGIEAIIRKEVLDFENRINQIRQAQQAATVAVSNSIVSVNLIEIV